jgi:hypothetical protein
MGCWPNSADDGVAETLLPHIFEKSQQQGCPDSVFSCLRFDAGGAEEVGTGGVMAGWTAMKQGTGLRIGGRER